MSQLLLLDAKIKMMSRRSCLLEAINRNGLVYFLLGNLLTGLINMSIPTIHTPALPAVTILFLYSLALSLIVYILHLSNITLRFW